eukprot:5391976-Prymnesium_polylepis.1
MLRAVAEDSKRLRPAVVEEGAARAREQRRRRIVVRVVRKRVECLAAAVDEARVRQPEEPEHQHRDRREHEPARPCRHRLQSFRVLERRGRSADLLVEEDEEHVRGPVAPETERGQLREKDAREGLRQLVAAAPQRVIAEQRHHGTAHGAHAEAGEEPSPQRPALRQRPLRL